MKSTTSYSDMELVRMLKEGDNHAFQTLYKRYRIKAIDQAFQRIRDKEAAEDIVQNIFLKIWANHAVTEINHFESFVSRSVRNGVFNYFDSLRVKHKYFEPFRQIHLDHLEDMDAATKLNEKELLALILSYAKALPEKRRRIFLLHIQEKLDTKEIAERLDISQKTVQNNIRLAILELQEMIGPSALVLLLSLLNSDFTKN